MTSSTLIAVAPVECDITPDEEILVHMVAIEAAWTAGGQCHLEGVTEDKGWCEDGCRVDPDEEDQDEIAEACSDVDRRDFIPESVRQPRKVAKKRCRQMNVHEKKTHHGVCREDSGGSDQGEVARPQQSIS